MQTFEGYEGTLPYASEVFGIYQPLLGWKSALIQKRYDAFRRRFQDQLALRAMLSVRAPVEVSRIASSTDSIAPLAGMFEVEALKPANLEVRFERRMAPAIDSGIARMIASGLDEDPPADWTRIVNDDAVAGLLERLKATLGDPERLRQDPLLSRYVEDFQRAMKEERVTDPLALLFEVESKVAGYLLLLATADAAALTPLFYAVPRAAAIVAAQRQDPLLSFGQNAYEAILSPVGIIHLYRQYFFEFDSFLGPPVGHVWLSPGGTVELIEVSTRHTVTERTFEQSQETTVRSESEVTTRDDISDAVKEENRDSVKFGFTTTGSYQAAVYSASASADLSIENSKARARETTHQQMREQSEKLSSEIKRNFRTTFKTSTEVTDTASKRYVIANGTSELMNYELRRKMRKVGVQVQDIGVALCWHTFVDDAGRDLGISRLVHIGEPPELGDLPQPEAPEFPTSQPQEVNIAIPFVGLNTDDVDNAYTDGVETEVGLIDQTEKIQADFEQAVMFSAPGYTLIAVDIRPQGFDAVLSVKDLHSAEGSSAATFTIHIDYVAWGGKDQIPATMTLHWRPSETLRQTISEEYEKRLAEYSAEKSRRFKEAFYEAARERIKLASNIAPRPSEDLREEERTVVYRALISQLMGGGGHQSKHVTSELVRSIFDVDKMLYFVAPEWWAPRLHRSSQHLGEPSGEDGGGPLVDANIAGTAGMFAARLHARRFGPGSGASARSAIPPSTTVDWGGAKELNRDNYYITEDSRPARLGASLGWLLQLDGDNLRNAFLNSPWVKAVIPIRIGKERAALNWLQQAHVEGTDGLDAEYVPPEGSPAPATPLTIRQALDALIDKIKEYDDNARTPIEPDPANPDAADEHFKGSLPAEAVFENGFYPLQGGVRFDGDPTRQALISQWMEILPTDQVAAVAVEYDPRTLQVVHGEDEPPVPPA